MEKKEFWAILSTGIAIIVLLLMIQGGVSGNTRAIADNARAIADLREDTAEGMAALRVAIADLRTEIIRETSRNREDISRLDSRLGVLEDERDGENP